MTISARGTTRNGAVSPRFTLDTNLLVYSVDAVAGRRHDLSLQIVDGALDVDCWLTLQSISEFFSVVARKRIMPAAEAAAQAQDWLIAFPCTAASADAIRAALADSVAGRASYWDALLVATAAEAGCRLILTEDLTDGASLQGVEIHNPFTPGGGLTRRVRRLLDL
jgi:predicted nucleic acid-binding protein